MPPVERDGIDGAMEEERYDAGLSEEVLRRRQQGIEPTAFDGPGGMAGPFEHGGIGPQDASLGVEDEVPPGAASKNHSGSGSVGASGPGTSPCAA